jgi:predicted phosphate transport protein (TIGR00153 family)
MAIRLTPRERGFYPLFVQAAEIIADAADQLATLVAAEPPNREAIAKQIKELETEGDELTHQILIKLNSSFITPFDREDIHRLASSLDDVLDEIEEAADRSCCTGSVTCRAVSPPSAR